MTTGEDQVISCSIFGLERPVDVTWTNTEGEKIPASTGYVMYDGKYAVFGGIQTTTLTLRAAQVALIESSKTYKCLMTSTADPPSHMAEKSITLTLARGNGVM